MWAWCRGTPACLGHQGHHGYQSNLPFPSPEVRGPSHSTGAQSRPCAAAHGAGPPASSCGPRGACLLHLPGGKVGWGPGWAGEGCSSGRPPGGKGAGGPPGPQPGPRLHLGLWAADSALPPTHTPGSSRAQVLLRKIWLLPFHRHRVGDLTGCCVSSATRWAAEAWNPARGLPR